MPSTRVEPDLSDIQRISVNGVTLSVRVEGEGPLCILVHGWPELGLSWRHQVQPLVDAGYQVAVPDVRGYGGSDAPRAVAAYSMQALTGDVIAILDALGEDDAVVVGHDWGAPIAWHTALLHPDRVRAVAGMSVPYYGQGPAPPTDVLKMMYAGKFFYILYFQDRERPEREFSANVREALLKVYFCNCGDSTKAARAAMRVRGPDSGYLDGLVVPDTVPDWLGEDELAAYVAAFEHSGFHGGFHRYRNMDSDWHALRHLKDAKVAQPAMFLAGEHDSVLRYMPGTNLMDALDPFYEDLRGKHVIRGAGHWVQQEKPEAVNRHLLAFLAGLRRD